MRMAKLLGKMAEKNITQKALADYLGMAQNTVNSRISGKSEFKTSEVEKICSLLNINSAEEKCEIFLH